MAELDEIYKIGIKIIDHQHIDIILTLKKSIDASQSSRKSKREFLDDLLLDLKNYSKIHLDYEEARMKKYQFPEYDRHHDLHNFFRAKIMSLQANIKENEEVKIKQVALFLKDWFLHHIQTEDKKYGDHEKSLGILDDE